MSDREDTTEFAGRILDADGRIVEFITLSYGDPVHEDAATDLIREQLRGIMESLEGTEYHLVDRHGDREVLE